VAANLVVRTGSDANPADRPGLAAFASSLLDQGTSTKSALQIADSVAQLGARLAASTTMDASFLRGQSLKKNFTAMLDLMADVALHPSFPAEEVERQRASRLAQLAQQRQNAPALAGNMMVAALYGTRHPYGSSELGTEASVKAIARRELEAFWRRSFVPSNAALVVAGDISMAELRPLAEKAFGSWNGGSATVAKLDRPETADARVIIVDKPGAPQTELRVAGIGAPRSTPDYRSIQVMNLALGGLFSSRINQDLREEKGYTYGARSQFAFRRGPGPFSIATGVRTDVTAPAVDEIFKQLKGMFENPLTAAELKMAKDALAQSLPGAFETSASAAGSFSNVYIYDLGLDYYTKYAAGVEAVTLAQAQAAVEKYVQPDRFVVIAVGDRGRIQPELEKLNLGKVEVRSAQ
jgi:zinc protease